MSYTIDGNKIDFVEVYDWFDVYINNTTVLHHISKDEANDLKNLFEGR